MPDAANFAVAWLPARPSQRVLPPITPRSASSIRTGSRNGASFADLLIVVDKTASGAIRDRRAVFVQAEDFLSHGVISISATSRHQLELYEFWPFSFVSGPYKPVARDFAASGQPGSSSESGRW